MKPLDDEPSEKGRRFQPDPAQPIVHGVGELPEVKADEAEAEAGDLRKPGV